MPASADHLADLIRFDTVSRHSNLALIEWVERFLARLGIASERVASADGDKANLIAVLGPSDRPGIVLSGHTDTVPVDDQDWTLPPFDPVIRERRMFGRGTTDMKGFLAGALALAERLAGRALARPLILALSYDEEVGCRGVPSLLDRLGERLPRPVGCVVGEPTVMRVADGHKGKAAACCRVRGREAHSALPQLGVNAVVTAARIVAFVAQEAERLAREGPFADGFVPPHTTASVGRIEGGGQLNIIPNGCRFEFEFRSLPGEDPRTHVARVEAFARRELLPAMREVAPESAIEFEETIAYPGLAALGTSPFEQVCRALTETPRPGKVSFGTEAGHFARRGIPALVCGPGDMRVGHKPDEYVELAQLDACDRFLDGLATRMLLPA